jgi:hypothetical protein
LDEDQLEAVFEIMSGFLIDSQTKGEVIELSEEQKQSVQNRSG